MFRITKGTDMGWPYTYWDGVRKIRLAAPEYGGDGKTPVTDSKYATPVAAFAPLRPAVLDMAFYNGTQVPAPAIAAAPSWPCMAAAPTARWPGGHGGYNVVFVPFTGGRAGKPVVFADGFAGPRRTPRTSRPRPIARWAWRWARTARSMSRSPTRAGSGGLPTAKAAN